MTFEVRRIRTIFSVVMLLLVMGGGCGGGSSNPPPPLPPAAAPTFWPVSGSYSPTQQVTLSDATPGAIIHFTTDGSVPSESSPTYTGPIPIAATTTVQAIASASGYSASSVASAGYTIVPQTSTGPSVTIVLTTNDQSRLMAAQVSITFGTQAAANNTIFVDENQTYQEVEGFGASFTDSAAYLLNEVATKSARTSTMNDLFTRNGNGIGLSFMRNPMGASDIARSQYSFDDLTAGQVDPSLRQFSIAHDQTDIIPIIQQAKQLNPQMKLMATPWSPPGWMKSSDSLVGGTLLSNMYGPFANYFVKYLQAYAAAGIDADYLSLQNEPLNVPPDYPGMFMDAATQTILLRDYVLPAFASSTISTRLLVYDHNWDQPAYPMTVFSDSTLLTSSQVTGTAWHGYAGTPGVMSEVQTLYPAKGNYQTEHSGGTWVTDQMKNDFEEITEVMRNWGKAYVKWSLALDENRGPHTGGCGTCSGIVTVNSTNGAVAYGVEFYTLGHYSKFVLPGAVRIYSSNANGLISTAFQNADNSKVLVIYNDSSTTQSYAVQWGGQGLTYTLPALAGATFVWNGVQAGGYEVLATAQIQASSFNAGSGLQTEPTSDSNGGFDLGYATPGAYAEYKNVAFGTGMTGVSARVACDSSNGALCGGSLEFHLDSTDGALIATAAIPGTGGWQNWTTVSASVNGASGNHDLYVVFSGSNNLGNLNWFQFK